MAVYSGAEIFQIAMEMEDTGRVFYEKLAQTSQNPAIAELCRNLAKQEAEHYETFKKLGAELVKRPVSRTLTWDELSFAQILIEERVMSNPEMAEEAASSGDVSALLDTALQLEKDSVLFYRELLDEVDEKDAPAVQEIIDEEKRHVRALVKAKRELSQ
jgi:rubrerythrin